MEFITADQFSDVQKAVIEARLSDPPLSYKEICVEIKTRFAFNMYDSLIARILKDFRHFLSSIPTSMFPVSILCS